MFNKYGRGKVFFMAKRHIPIFARQMSSRLPPSSLFPRDLITARKGGRGRERLERKRRRKKRRFEVPKVH